MIYVLLSIILNSVESSVENKDDVFFV